MSRVLIILTIAALGSVALFAQKAASRPAYLLETVDLAPANSCGNIAPLETSESVGTVDRKSFGADPIKSFILVDAKGKKNYILVDWSYLERSGNGLPGDLRIVLGMGRKLKVTEYKCNDLRVMKRLVVM